MRVAIIGCGLIGNKRARALGDCRLVAAVDKDIERAEQLARQHPECSAGADWEPVVQQEDVNAVIVATTNNMLAPITLEAIRQGKHVLVEKPAARNADELRPVVQATQGSSVIVKVGFNHRFHPAIQHARRVIDTGTLGPLMYLRARYGHGGRIDYDREWRADPNMAGGGEMLDQGVHLIDLARWFLGDFTQVQGHIGTFFWKMAVEDNGFAILKTAVGQVAFLHASCTEWKNMFSFEIYGRDGKLQIDGLGGSYGVEKLTHYRMLPQMGPPEVQIWEYPGEDASWRLEFADFADSIARNRPPLGTLADALAALEVIQTLYRQNPQASGVKMG